MIFITGIDLHVKYIDMMREKNGDSVTRRN